MSNIMQQIVLLTILSLLFIILDIPYILNNKNRWNNMINNIQSSPIGMSLSSIASAMVVYAFLSVGLYNLVLTRDLDLQETVFYSGILGFTTYGVFNFTNMALFKRYELQTAIIDTAWGGIITAGVGYLSKIYLSS